MSIFNTLYHGSADEVCALLDDGTKISTTELRAALTNALRKIERLEAAVRGGLAKAAEVAETTAEAIEHLENLQAQPIPGGVISAGIQEACGRLEGLIETISQRVTDVDDALERKIREVEDRCNRLEYP